MTRAVDHKPCPRCKVSAVRAGFFGNEVPVCPRCGYPGAERRTQVERVQDLNAVSMAKELDRVEKLEAELEKAEARIRDLESAARARGNTAPARYYQPVCRLKRSNVRRVISAKVTEMTIEWLKRESALCYGAHGGPSSVAARILERAADENHARGGAVTPPPQSAEEGV